MAVQAGIIWNSYPPIRLAWMLISLFCFSAGREVCVLYVCANADKPLPFRDASLDGVLASHILEHLRSPIAFLEELHRILRPQGILVIGLPVEGGVAGPWIKYFKGHRGAHGHLYSFSPDNLDELLTLSGFRIEKYFFHIAKIGYKKRLLALHDFMQHLPEGLLYKVSSAYWAVAVRI